LALTALLYGYTAWTFVQDQLLPGRAPVVKVGSKAFTEAYIMAEIISARVEAATPYRATQTKSLGSAVIFEALKSGDLHAYLDFSGTIWVNVMKRGEPPKVRDAILGEVKSALAEEHDVLMLGALGYENLYAFAMRRAQAESLNIRTVSDMIRHAPTLEMAADFEFFGRPEWKSVQAKYGLSFRKRRTMDSALMYAALAEGDVDVISAYTTDGRIDAYDLVVLEDDRGAIPPYHGIVLLNGAFAREHPQVVEALKPMLGAFDETSVRKLNAQVDQDKRSPREVGQAAAKELFK
ncbi:MAG: glycine betaine ABC transporter substrate-binding protein, partial [Myxococcota bacterium]